MLVKGETGSTDTFQLAGISSNEGLHEPDQSKSGSYPANSWHFVGGGYLGNNPDIFVNGNVTSDNPGYSLNGGDLAVSQISLGGRTNNAAYFTGALSTIMIAENQFSNDYFQTQYNNQSNPSSFSLPGTPQSTSSGGDTQSPTAPTLSSTAQTNTSVDLSWSGATDNVGVTGYKIFKDGSLETTLNTITSYQVTGLAASTAYNFTAIALDAAGNMSTVSNAVSVTTDSSSGGGEGLGSSVWSEANSIASYSGEVAVGTASVPTGYQMAIDGKLITEEVKVQLSGNWPDYVFKAGYDLPTLEEIQKHIKEKGHLPNIPSAKEVEANGVELGEMDKLLLEKIEQLILFTIKQQQLLQEQQKEIEHLSTQNEKMVRFEKELTLIKQLLTQSSKQ